MEKPPAILYDFNASTQALRFFTPEALLKYAIWPSIPLYFDAVRGRGKKRHLYTHLVDFHGARRQVSDARTWLLLPFEDLPWGIERVNAWLADPETLKEYVVRLEGFMRNVRTRQQTYGF